MATAPCFRQNHMGVVLLACGRRAIRRDHVLFPRLNVPRSSTTGARLAAACLDDDLVELG